MIYYLNIPYNKYINRKDRDEYHIDAEIQKDFADWP